LKQRYWKIRNIISQILILVILGIALFWIGKNIYQLKSIIEMGWIRLLFGTCILLYTILCFNSINTMISNHIVQLYNPADPKSLAILAQQKKYKLDPKIANQLKQEGNPVQLISEWLTHNGYKQVAKHSLGLIYEKKTSFINYKFQNKYHRTFLLYRPLLNVLIIDNILSETSNFILRQKDVKPVSQNNLILITDMKNEEEVLSTGVGIVNYISTEQTSYLNPIFLDLNHAHLFYPQDKSLVPWYLQLSQRIKLDQLLTWLKEKLNPNLK